MGVGTGMKSLAEDIIVSHDVRTKELGSLAADTRRILRNAQTTLKDFAQDRRRMAGEQAEKLSKFRSNLSGSVGNLLREFRKNRKQMSGEQAANLANVLRGLKNFSKNLRKDVDLKLGGFAQDRNRMSEELKEKLKKEVGVIRTDVKKILGDADRLVAGYKTDMKEARGFWQAITGAASKSGGKSTEAARPVPAPKTVEPAKQHVPPVKKEVIEIKKKKKIKKGK